MATRALAHARRVPVAALALILASIVTACGGGGARDEGPFAYDAGRPCRPRIAVVDDDYPIAARRLLRLRDDTVDAFLRASGQ
jgi:hypothetical protein